MLLKYNLSCFDVNDVTLRNLTQKIVKINFFHIVSWAGYSIFYLIFYIIKTLNILALQIYKQLFPIIYTQKVILL